MVGTYTKTVQKQRVRSTFYTQRGFTVPSLLSSEMERDGDSSRELLNERDGDASRDRAGEGSRDPGSLSLVEYQEYSESSSPAPLLSLADVSSSIPSAIVSIPATISRLRTAAEVFFFFFSLRRFFRGFETGIGTGGLLEGAVGGFGGLDMSTITVGPFSPQLLVPTFLNSSSFGGIFKVRLSSSSN